MSNSDLHIGVVCGFGVTDGCSDGLLKVTVVAKERGANAKRSGRDVTGAAPRARARVSSGMCLSEPADRSTRAVRTFFIYPPNTVTVVTPNFRQNSSHIEDSRPGGRPIQPSHCTALTA